jgi:hypothetical protein
MISEVITSVLLFANSHPDVVTLLCGCLWEFYKNKQLRTAQTVLFVNVINVHYEHVIK